MDATIINNSVWEFKRGTVIREETDFVVVRMVDFYNPNWIYDVRFPREMIKFEPTTAQA